MAKSMWMVRASEGGRLVDEFIEKHVVGIGWEQIGDFSQYPDKPDILKAIRTAFPDWSPAKQQNGASQVYRFREEPKVGDRVLTYNPSRRVYHMGEIIGPARYAPDLVPPMHNIRDVKWIAEVPRDSLSTAAKNSLGAVLTLFRVPSFAAEEFEQLIAGRAPTEVGDTEEAEVEDEESLLKRYRKEAFEIVKDRINKLDPEEMERLVAGLLRAMGYKTRLTDPGPDRGVDVLASPDGLGFESPRIVAEVKHRSATIGSQDLRGFLGGRHDDDKGLYVSTGGFTKDARYEADRAKIPLTLMDLDGLVASLMEHYDSADSETRSLVPLRRIYWPV